MAMSFEDKFVLAEIVVGIFAFLGVKFVTQNLNATLSYSLAIIAAVAGWHLLEWVVRGRL